MDDYRVRVGWRNHPKRKMLEATLGELAVLRVMDLWEFCAAPGSRNDGDLSGMSNRAIAVAAGWAGDPDAFVSALADPEIGLLEGEPRGYRVHDWFDHNPYVAGSPGRRVSAAANVHVRYHKAGKHTGRVVDGCPACGSATVSMPPQYDGSSVVVRQPTNRTTPSPSPSPDPSPSPHDLAASSPRPPPAAPTEALAAVSPAFIGIPITGRGKGAEHLVSEADVTELETVFPAVLVRQELREIRQWCIDHPQRRKTGAGVRGFISRWLGKEQDRGGAPGNQRAGPTRLTGKAANTRAAVEAAHPDMFKFRTRPNAAG